MGRRAADSVYSGTCAVGGRNAARHGQPHKAACHAAEPIRPPQAQLCTGGGLHDALVRGQWHTAPWGGGANHTPTPHDTAVTAPHTKTLLRSPQRPQGWRVLARPPYSLPRTTWSPQGGGQGGEGAGPKVNRGHHWHRERGQPHTHMGTHNAPPHSALPAPHTATAHAAKH